LQEKERNPSIEKSEFFFSMRQSDFGLLGFYTNCVLALLFKDQAVTWLLLTLAFSFRVGSSNNNWQK